MTPERGLAKPLAEAGMIDPESAAKSLLDPYLKLRASSGARSTVHHSFAEAISVNNADKILPLRPGSISLPPCKEDEILQWATQRVGTTPEIWGQWSEAFRKYQISFFSNQINDPEELQKYLAKRVSWLVIRVKDEIRDTEGEIFYEDFVQKFGEVTGRSVEEVEAWFQFVKDFRYTPDFPYQPLGLPSRRPTTPAAQWMRVAQTGRNSWMRGDAQKDKQRKLRGAFEKAGLDFESILETVASWHLPTAEGPEKGLILSFFDKEQGAAFKRPKKK